MVIALRCYLASLHVFCSVYRVAARDEACFAIGCVGKHEECGYSVATKRVGTCSIIHSFVGVLYCLPSLISFSPYSLLFHNPLFDRDVFQKLLAGFPASESSWQHST